MALFHRREHPVPASALLTFCDLAFPPQIVPVRRRSTLPQCSRKHDDCDEAVPSEVRPGRRYHVFGKCRHLVHHMLQIKPSV